MDLCTFFLAASLGIDKGVGLGPDKAQVGLARFHLSITRWLRGAGLRVGGNGKGRGRFNGTVGIIRS